MQAKNVCDVCDKSFDTKSNLTRHQQIHLVDRQLTHKCLVCSKCFDQKTHLDRHKKIHFYPQISLYKQNEAKIKCTKEATKILQDANIQAKIDPQWYQPDTAERAAKSEAGESWKACVIMTFGKYRGQSFKWLLENDVGWTAWLLSQYIVVGEKDPLMKWQKQTLLDLVREFPSVMVHVDRRVKQHEQDKELASRSVSATVTQPTATASSDADLFMDDDADAELLAVAQSYLHESQVPVDSTLTTVGKLATSQSSKIDTATESPISSALDVVFEGWQKSWEVPSSSHGNITPNLRWLRENLDHGLFHPSQQYKARDGSVVERKVFKDCMLFNPPPVPTTMMGSVPNMHAFFTTPVFFWRPVGVMHAKLCCPNKSCTAPPDSFLIRHGYGSTARQVCSEHHYYTLLTERLLCPHCQKLRQSSATRQDSDSDDDDDGSGNLQYIWNAFSPSILLSLSPAVRNMFPAVICGKRAIDKSVITLLDDRLNAVSMSKVLRLLKQQHDKWYADRRDLYQTFLYEAHTAKKASQSGILQFVRPSGSYTPPIPQPQLPGERVLRRAHLIQEMERMPDYRASILSTTGEILCIDGTKQILKKIYGTGKDTMQFVTSVLNEWGQFVTTIVVASESEDCYMRMARGLVSRFKRMGAAAPKILYADNNCCRNGAASFLEVLFRDWVDHGMVIRLDIRHWLHRWDAVVIKQTHAKYPGFMSALAGSVLAYNRDDMMKLVGAVRRGNMEMFASYSDEQMLSHLKPYQIKAYVRRTTRSIEETASSIEHIIKEFKGPAGLDIDGIPLFKSEEAVDTHWSIASKHLGCMQDVPGVQLYVATKTVMLNGVELLKYRCRRGSNSLEGLHSHLVNAIPSKRCGLMPFQVYLISFAVQWNNRMESLSIAGGKGRRTMCSDPRQIQRLNQQAEVLFGKDHLFEPNFVAPMPFPDQYKDPDEEELLGIEYAMCQSSSFKSKDYYAKEAEKEQQADDTTEDESEIDEGIASDEEEAEMIDDPIDDVSQNYTVMTSRQDEMEDQSPAMRDVLAESHLHLPGYAEVEALGIALLKLADDGVSHLVPPEIRNMVLDAAGRIKDHDKSVHSFIKKYESKWGYTLFGRCLGPESPEASAAQKTRFATRYAPAVRISEESRLLYLLIKMLKNRPPASHQSPAKMTSTLKANYKRIVDRVLDDPILSRLNLPLPNINNKSISTFLRNEEKKANFRATVIPNVRLHKQVLSTLPLPEASQLPSSKMATHEEVQYTVPRHLTGKRTAEKRRLDIDAGSLQASSSSPAPVPSKIRPIQPKDTAPVLLVFPSQPQGPSISFGQNNIMISPPAKPLATRTVPPGKSGKPCALCRVPNCGGNKKRYTPSKDKVGNCNQKIFTYCPTTRKSTASGFNDVYHNYEHFKQVVDQFLQQNQQKS